MSLGSLADLNSAILKDIRIDTSSVSLPIAEGASFDSFSDQLNSRCHAETRLALRQRIRDWFQDTDGTCIFWLSGMAGTGKSTILRSMAQEFQDQQKLAATFFFKRGEGARGNASRFFATMASQLMQNIPKLGVFIKEACKADPHIHDKSMVEQFRCLIKDPMIKYENGKHSPLLIVIDALDECDGEGDARLVIQLLAEINSSNEKSFRLLLSSRPEAPIRTTFGKLPDTKYISCILHELSDEIRHDIKVYLKDELCNLQKNPEFELQDDWPTDAQIDALVTIAEPLFIAAATIIRFISDPRWEPERQLECMLSYQKADHFDRLGLVYQPVLDQMLLGMNKSQEQEMLADFQSVIGTIVVLEDALSRTSLAALLGVSTKFIARRLSMLHSVLRIPIEEHVPIRLLHLSFRDFLTGDTQKDDRFLVDQCKTHQKIGQACLRLLMMTPCLKQDICDIGKPAVERRSIDRDLIMAKISPEVQYASRYWIDHICKGQDTSSNYLSILKFLKAKFLYWVEALVLLGHRPEIKVMLESLQTNCQSVGNTELESFLGDALDFISLTGSLLDIFPLQMYSSGLIFTPKQSIIRNIFEHQIPSWVDDLPRALDLRSNSSPIHIGHTSPVYTIALSPDEQQLSTGSFDGSIKLWKTDTGLLQHTLQGHKDVIFSLAYIQQGKFLLSHSMSDENVMIWNTKKGHMERIIEIGSGFTEFTLSHSGQLLAISLLDEGSELWNLNTYTRKSSVRGLSTTVLCTKFSQDDTMLALALKDNIIVTDTSNSTEVGVFRGLTPYSYDPKSTMERVILSLSSSLLAAAGYTDGIWVWSLSKVQLLYKLDTGSDLWDLVFLSDGSRLVSSSIPYQKQCVQVWDCKKRCLDSDYPDCAGAIALSQDETRLAMANFMTGDIQIVNMSTAAIEKSLDSHKKGLTNFLFLKNGTGLLSRYYDSVDLWDLDRGSKIYGINCSAQTICEVLLSPDGMYLAMQLANHEITVWSTTSTIISCKFHSDGRLVKFSPMSSFLVTSTGSGIELWNTAAGDLQIRLLASGNRFQETIQFLPNESRLMLCDREGRLSFWNIVTGDQFSIFHDDTPTETCSANISPDGKKLATSDKQGTIRIWDMSSGILLRTLFMDQDCDPRSLRFCPKGEYIVHTTKEEIMLWNLDTGLKQWSVPVYCRDVSFSHDGKQILHLDERSPTGTTYCIRDLVTGKLLESMDVTNLHGSSKARFSRNEQYLETEWGTLPRKQQDSTLKHVHLSSNWLTINGENMLWLPAPYRPTCSDCRDGKLAYGYASGEVVLYDIISESFQSMPAIDDK